MTHREQKLFFETLELLRRTAARLSDFQGMDWKDVDDYIFSELSFTQEEVDRLYEDTAEMVYTASCVSGPAPADPTYEEVWPYFMAGAKFSCQIVSHGNWNTVCLVAKTPDHAILLTEADCPELRDFVGKEFGLIGRDRTSTQPSEVTFMEMDRGMRWLYTVSEADR